MTDQEASVVASVAPSPCPVCGSRSWNEHLDFGAYRYLRCPQCEVGRLDPTPSPSESATLFGDDYFKGAANTGYDDYVADAKVHRRNGRRRMSRIGPPPASSNLLVDVGCAHGYTMMEAAVRGWVPLGVDTNASARAAVEQAGMGVAARTDDLGLPEGSVGAVTFFQVLEHLPDALEHLRWAQRVLIPGGTVTIETWNSRSLLARVLRRRWQVASPPSVVWLFSPRAMAEIAAVSDLEVVSFRRSFKWVTLGLVVGQMQSRGARGPLVRLGQRVRSLPLPYALGDLVTVTLRKPMDRPRP